LYREVGEWMKERAREWMRGNKWRSGRVGGEVGDCEENWASVWRNWLNTRLGEWMEKLAKEWRIGRVNGGREKE
jgi:hypothetical protein